MSDEPHHERLALAIGIANGSINPATADISDLISSLLYDNLAIAEVVETWIADTQTAGVNADYETLRNAIRDRHDSNHQPTPESPIAAVTRAYLNALGGQVPPYWRDHFKAALEGRPVDLTDAPGTRPTRT